MSTARRLLVVRDLARRLGAHRVPAMAGESAFFVALAVFPTLLTVVAVVRAAGPFLGVGADAEAARGMTALLRVVLSTRGGGAADAARTLLEDSSDGLLTVGTAAALVLMMRALRSVLYGLGVVGGRDRRRAWPAALTLAVVTVVAAAITVAAAVQNPLRFVGLPGGSALWAVLRWPVAAVFLLGLAALLLRVGLGPLPRRRLVLGAVLSTTGWCAASLLFPLYVAVATRVSPTFGALGGGLVLLVWLYLLMLALLVAGVVASPRDRGPVM